MGADSGAEARRDDGRITQARFQGGGDGAASGGPFFEARQLHQQQRRLQTVKRDVVAFGDVILIGGGRHWFGGVAIADQQADSGVYRFVVSHQHGAVASAA